MKTQLTSNNYNILLEGTSWVNLIKERENDIPREIPEEAYKDNGVYATYIGDVKASPYPKEGRALFEYLIANLLLPPQNAIEGYKTPGTLEELQEYLKHLNTEYRTHLSEWMNRNASELSPSFASDVSVMAKDVVRTEKTSPYIKPNYQVFGGGEKKDNHGNDDNNPNNNPDALHSSLHSNSTDALIKIIKGDITKKYLIPFFLKELAERRLVEVYSRGIDDGTFPKLSNEETFDLLSEDELRCLVVAHSPQIRMFSILVTSFVQKLPISYVQGMNDFIGSLVEQGYVTLEEGTLFGMDLTSFEDVEGLIYFMFRRIVKIHRRAFTTQPLNGAMTVLDYLGDVIAELRPPLYCAMQRTDYDSVLLYLLNPYLLFFRREVESGAASLRLLCAALSSEIGYNLLFVFIIAYIDINVAPVLSSILTAKGDRVEPVLSKLSCQPKVKAIELLALAQRYMEHTHTKNIILDFLGHHYTP